MSWTHLMMIIHNINNNNIFNMIKNFFVQTHFGLEMGLGIMTEICHHLHLYCQLQKWKQLLVSQNFALALLIRTLLENIVSSKTTLSSSSIELGFFNPTLRQNSTKVTSQAMQLENREDR